MNDDESMKKRQCSVLRTYFGRNNEHLELALWISKFCRHIDNDGKRLTDSENLKFFKEKLHEQFGWTFEGDE